jgi:hypothetical protein
VYQRELAQRHADIEAGRGVSLTEAKQRLEHGRTSSPVRPCRRHPRGFGTVARWMLTQNQGSLSDLID